jgi:uncharacterized membrane protein YfcA
MAWNPRDLIELALLLLGVGVLSGTTAGLLGVGGGIIIVPVLFHLFTAIGIEAGTAMHVAVGTSLATIIATSISSLRAHRQRGSVDETLVRAWAPALLIGVLVGATIAGYVRGTVLIAVFASVALIVAVHMAFAKPSWLIRDALPTGMQQQAMAGAIGVVSAMMGIGGGTLSVPLLTLFGYPIHRAVGSAAALGLLIGIPGTLSFIISGWNAAARPPFSLGYVNLLGFLLILPTSMYFAVVGARLAHSLNNQNLRRVFALFLAVTSVRMFWGILR